VVSNIPTTRGARATFLTLRVLPFGPTMRCLRLTNRSLFRTSPPILMTSQAMSSCRTLRAYTERQTARPTGIDACTHLRRVDTSGEQLEHVPPLENDVRVPSLPRGLDRHLSLDEVELTRQPDLLERRSDRGPDRAEVWFAILGEEQGERGFLCEGSVRVGGGCGEGLDGPMINVIGVPCYASQSGRWMAGKRGSAGSLTLFLAVALILGHVGRRFCRIDRRGRLAFGFGRGCGGSGCHVWCSDGDEMHRGNLTRGKRVVEITQQKNSEPRVLRKPSSPPTCYQLPSSSVVRGNQE
jgi:hypothetical protein